MPIIVNVPAATAPAPIVVPNPNTVTVQNIIDACALDAQNIFFSNGGNQNLLIAYLDRIHQQLLRFARWEFLLSPVKRFITQAGQTDYWLGTAGSNPTGTVDTGLNLGDLDRIKEGTVFDRTNFRQLKKVLELEPMRGLNFSDASSRPSTPKMWRQDHRTTPFILNLYPAPDVRATSLSQPRPEVPYCQAIVSGALAARTYFVRVTFTDSAGGESNASADSTKIFIPANSVLLVNNPTPTITASATNVSYNGWNVYVSTTQGAEVKQNASPLAIGTNFQEPNTGLVVGAGAPSNNTLEALQGYIIEFRYYIQRATLSLVSQTLQIPDIYKDIVIAGVNEYLFNYAAQADPRYLQFAQYWSQRYTLGKTEIIKDFNLFPKDADVILPDRVVRATFPYGDTDFFVL